MQHKPLTPKMTNIPQPMAEVVGKLPAEIQAKTRIVPKLSKEEMAKAMEKANNSLGKCAGHTTRY